MSTTTASPFWNRSTFLVITGASRGIGKTIAVEFAGLVSSNSTLVLLARSTSNLEETKKQILELFPKLDIKICSIDLSKPNSQEFDSLLTSSASGKQFDLYLLIHNAGTLITEVPASEAENVQQWNDYMSLNLYSVTALTSSFLKLFTQGERCIVNISSLMGVQPAKGLVFYCVGKASREMYFRVLAEENPFLSILSYSPGPIDTDMLQQIAKDCCYTDMKMTMQNMLESKSTVKVEDSVRKLANTLENRSYKNGGRIDFFCREESAAKNN